MKKEKLQDVAKGDMYQVNNHDKYTPRSHSEIVEQAEKLVGQEIYYSLLTNNCEHFANKLRYGIAYSAQVTFQLMSPPIAPMTVLRELYREIAGETEATEFRQWAHTETST